MHPRRIEKDNLRRRVNALARGNLHDAGDAVARGLRLGGDNRHFFARQGVQQRAFADVRPAQNSDKSRFHECNQTPA